jgi:hypothetical protein
MAITVLEEKTHACIDLISLLYRLGERNWIPPFQDDICYSIRAYRMIFARNVTKCHRMYKQSLLTP